MDNDLLKYDVYFGLDNPPAMIVEGLSENYYEVTMVSDDTYLLENCSEVRQRK